LVFITEMKSVYSAVRTGSLNKAVCGSSVKGESLLYYCSQRNHPEDGHTSGRNMLLTTVQ
jgi:hypothetical protein